MMPVSLRNKLLILITLSTQALWACEFCNLMDYGNVNNQTFVRIDYKYRLYGGYNRIINPYTGSQIAQRQGLAPHRSSQSEKNYISHEEDYELYRVINLGFNYNYKERLNVMINLPYVSNIDYYGLVIPEIGAGKSEKDSYKGLGDLNIGAQKIFLKQLVKYKHTLKIGVLFTLPTGRNTATDLFSSNIHMQPSRSIYATEFSANYTFENTGLWGLNLNTSYYKPINETSYKKANSYHFSKRLSIDLHGFKAFKGDLKKVVLAGVKTEITGTEFINQFVVYDSGSELLSATIGTLLQYKNNVFMASFDLPIYQNLTGFQLQNKYALSLSLMHYLNKKEMK